MNNKKNNNKNYIDEGNDILLQTIVYFDGTFFIPQTNQMHAIEQILPFRLRNRLLFQYLEYDWSHGRPNLLERSRIFALCTIQATNTAKKKYKFIAKLIEAIKEIVIFCNIIEICIFCYL